VVDPGPLEAAPVATGRVLGRSLAEEGGQEVRPVWLDQCFCIGLYVASSSRGGRATSGQGRQGRGESNDLYARMLEAGRGVTHVFLDQET